MKAVVGWVLALLSVIAADAGVEAGTGATSPAVPARHPSLLLRELWNISEGMAAANGDADAALRQGVGPVSRQLAEQVSAGAGIDSTVPVYVIEFAGQFICKFCSSPVAPREPVKPHAAVIAMTLAAATLHMTDFGFTRSWVSLEQLGTPFTLPAPPPPARYWSVRPASG